jgi:hypothetical protein
MAAVRASAHGDFRFQASGPLGLALAGRADLAEQKL